MKLRLSAIRSVVIGLILLALGGGVGYYLGNREWQLTTREGLPQLVVNANAPAEYEEVDFSLFWEVWNKLDSEYLDNDKLMADEMVYGAIEGMVGALGDPYTVFLPPEDQQRTEEDLSGAFEGVGIQLGYVEKQLAVMAPLSGMPAEAAGVEAGDLILHISDTGKGVDVDTNGMSLPEAVSIIRGEHGQPVTLTLYRPDSGQQPFEVTIERDTIVVPSVELEFVEDDDGTGQIAHLSLLRFGGRTDDEWNDAVSQIIAAGDVDGVVLDLRNNPGGYLNGAIFIASEFVEDGVIVQQQGKRNTETYSVNRRGRLTNMPVTVLVNRGSASASEIVAGALRDRIGAKLVGTRTFGKGTVQNAEDLREDTGLHITVARWLLPSGDWIHESGIEPDIEATNSAETADVDEMLEAALETL